MNNILNRISQISDNENITITSLEKVIGASKGVLSRALTNNSDIQSKWIQLIVEKYPQYNANWLLTGEGEMFKDSKKDACADNAEESLIDRIPLLPLSAQGGSLNDFIMSVRSIDCEKIISPIQGASFAITVSGDSMAPEYPSGSTVLVKKIDESIFIEWGRVYVLDTRNGVVIKRLVPSDKEGCIRCKSDNTDPIFSPFDVCKKDIYGIYRVLLCMSIK